MASRFSAQMSGQMPGCPAATRVMSRKPPAARRSSAPSCSAPALAADAGIGIYDIEIAHSAEGPRGVLILVVDGADADTLARAVEEKGYRCQAAHLS